ncbi:MAG: hypothetical protein R2800_02950 [Flavipsychrobacter sp.]
MKLKFVTTLFLASFITLQANAQGCSDAGFCTAGALKGTNSNNQSSIALSTAISSGENGTNIITPQLELKAPMGTKGYIEGKLPINIASGEAGSHTGIGDLIVTYTRPLAKKFALNGTVGTRVSFGDATATDNNQPLPMPYQSNLGTTDLIVGVSAKWGKYISTAIGYQQPLIQYNNNQYSLSSSTYNTYFESANLERSGDILFRVQGHYDWEKLGISAGPLFIYHLANDKITYASGVNSSVAGSQGLTINITGNIYYKIRNWQVDISAGSPVQVRTARPDGLTKSWTVIPRLTYNFHKEIKKQ